MGAGGASQREAWLTLSLSTIAPRHQRALVEAIGSPEAVLGADNAALTAVDGVTAAHVSRLRAAQAEAGVPAMLESLGELGAELLPFTDERYPALLLETADPPALLYVRGEITARDDLSVALVEYLRPEAKFDSLDALVTQMDADSSRARAILSAQ